MQGFGKAFRMVQAWLKKGTVCDKAPKYIYKKRIPDHSGRTGMKQWTTSVSFQLHKALKKKAKIKHVSGSYKAIKLPDFWSQLKENYQLLLSHRLMFYDPCRIRSTWILRTDGKCTAYGFLTFGTSAFPRHCTMGEGNVYLCELVHIISVEWIWC